MYREYRDRTHRNGWDDALTAIRARPLRARPLPIARRHAAYVLHPVRRTRPLLVAAAISAAVIIFGTGGMGIVLLSSYGAEQMPPIAPLPHPTLDAQQAIKEAQTPAGKASNAAKSQSDKTPGTARSKSAGMNGATAAKPDPKSTSSATTAEKPTDQQSDRKQTDKPADTTPPSSAPGDGQSVTAQDTSAGTPAAAQPPQVVKVTFSANGPDMPDVSIGKGATVTFVNASGADIRPVADAGQPAGFDAGPPVAPGGYWSIVFNNNGSWHYHDELKPSSTGSVTVTAAP